VARVRKARPESDVVDSCFDHLGPTVREHRSHVYNESHNEVLFVKYLDRETE